MIPPEVQPVAVTLQDGSLAIMQFVTKQQRFGDDPGWTREATNDAINAEIAKAGLSAKNWRRIDFGDLPTDRTYRDAWTDDGNNIAIDQVKRAAIDAAGAKPTQMDALTATLFALTGVLVAKNVITAGDITAASGDIAAKS